MIGRRDDRHAGKAPVCPLGSDGIGELGSVDALRAREVDEVLTHHILA